MNTPSCQAAFWNGGLWNWYNQARRKTHQQTPVAMQQHLLPGPVWDGGGNGEIWHLKSSIPLTREVVSPSFHTLWRLRWYIYAAPSLSNCTTSQSASPLITSLYLWHQNSTVSFFQWKISSFSIHFKCISIIECNHIKKYNMRKNDKIDDKRMLFFILLHQRPRLNHTTTPHLLHHISILLKNEKCLFHCGWCG